MICSLCLLIKIKREKYYNKCKYNITKVKNEKIKTIQEDLNKFNQGKCLIQN